MTKQTKIVIALIALFFVFTCSACSNEEQTKPKDKKTNTTVEKKYIPPSKGKLGKYKGTFGDNLLVDAIVDVPVPNVEKSSILPVEGVKFDEKQLCDIFFGSKQLKSEKNPYNSQYSSGDDQLNITLPGGSLKYNTSHSDDILNIFDLEDNKNEDKYKLKKLDFMTKEEAIKKASEMLKKINITPYGIPKVYSLDYTSLKQEQDRLMREDSGFKDFVNLGKIKLKDSWSKDDDCYFLSFYIGINGLPCSSVNFTTKNESGALPGSYVNILISKNGIESCDAFAIYREKSSVGNTSSLISIEQALNKLSQKYNDVITSDKLTVTNISLAYTAKATSRTGDTVNVELTPTWIFDVKQKGTDSKKGGISQRTVVVRINAIDGKEIL